MVKASNASASKHGEAYVGGWLTDCTSTSPKDQVLWFQLWMNPSSHAWAFKEGDPSRRIAALEMFGAPCCSPCCSKRSPGAINLPMEFVTDNQGNAYSLLSGKAKEFPCSAFLLLYNSGLTFVPHIGNVTSISGLMTLPSTSRRFLSTSST